LIAESTCHGSVGLSTLIYYLPINRLPGQPAERLKVLFEIRGTWPRDDLIQRMTDLTPSPTETKLAEQLILKHAKLIRTGGGIWFVPRRDLASRR
jgi:hypothetical protein